MILDGSNLVVWSQSLVQDKIGIPGGGVPPGRLISTTAPLTGGGDLSSDRTLAIPKATSLVDGYLSALDFTQFIAKENPITFNAPLSRVVDTVSLPKATGAVDGYLSAADFVVFSSKVSTNRQINTTAPLTGGGDLSADRTIAMPASTNSVDGYLTSADHTTFAAKESALTFSSPLSRSVNTISIPVATASVNGYLSSTDFTTFSAKVSASRTLNTTAPITGGGDLSADRTFAMAKATASVDGYLAAADFTTFNNKVGTTRNIATTSPLTGGGDLSADRTISFSNQSANLVLSGPATGAAAAPTFRSLVAADIPSLSATYLPLSGGTLTGNLLFSTDNTLDIGASGATRPRDVNVGRNVVVGGGVVASQDVSVASAAYFRVTNRLRFWASADGIAVLQNSGQTDFTRQCYGGVTNSFPALARSSTTLKAVLADNSGDCPFTAKNFACDGTGVGFNGVATVGKSAAYTVTNQTASRTLDVSTVTLTQLANVVAAVIQDLKTPGLFS